MKILLRNKDTKSKSIYDTNHTPLLGCYIIATSVGLYYMDYPDKFGFSDISEVTKFRFSNCVPHEVLGYEYKDGWIKVSHSRHKIKKNQVYKFTHKPDLYEYPIWSKEYRYEWMTV